MTSKTVFTFLCMFALYALFRPEAWPVPHSIPHLDKFAHFGLFLILSCASYFVFLSFHPALYLTPFLVLAGVSEWFQWAFLPGRHFSLMDLQANLLGISVGFLFCLTCRNWSWRLQQ